jgi:hypothetical protein
MPSFKVRFGPYKSPALHFHDNGAASGFFKITSHDLSISVTRRAHAVLTYRGAIRMMILDAISGASSEHAVYFLVTAYIESLHHFHRGLGIPECVVRLPVRGRGDLEERLESLHHGIDLPLEAIVPASEVSAVLATAVHRLAYASSQAGENR